jgi:indolepyruvate ferredoxin oxidoreductase alpha subunit
LSKEPFERDSPGERVILLGNEAIARGALESGVMIVAGYPGTPSTEIVETIAELCKKYAGIYVEWSINEKVAFETAFGGSMCGLRSAAVMKHVGVNVAADPFVTACYAGARGGFVLIESDDPECFSSQNEQDNRYLARHALCPVLEPSNVEEAKEMTKFAFEFSERYETLVMLRSTTRLSHSRGDVVLGEIPERKNRGNFDHNKARWTYLPVNARIYHRIMLDRFQKIEEAVNENPFNRISLSPNSKNGIIAPGLPFAYVIDFLKSQNLETEISYLKLATSFPPPKKLIQKFLKNLKRVLVVEELEPFIEDYINIFAKEINPQLEVVGKKLLPRNGELTPQIVEDAINKFLRKESESQVNSTKAAVLAPPRPPVLCAGCPHRACFYALKGAEKRAGKKFIYSSDIGCYTLGYYPPLETIETCLCMGASIGMAHGIVKSGDPSPVFAILGDSTFFHAGIPSLANLVYNKSPVNVLVVDNVSTAMTGFQPHPGTGIRITGEKTKRILIEELGKGLGVEFIRVFDPYDLDATIKVILEAIEYKEGPKLLISRHPCSLLEFRGKQKKGERVQLYTIDTAKCNKCRICTSSFGCPAFFIDEETNEIRIVEKLCVGCGVCLQICPVKAIIPLEK